MARKPLFAILAGKMERARSELDRLGTFLAEQDSAARPNAWSRIAMIAYVVHGVYNGMEDVMADIASAIDDHVPKGASSHQALLDQMRTDMGDLRPALLDRDLHRDLSELKAFRHFVRHQYGVDLVPEKVEAKLALLVAVLPSFERALLQLESLLAER